MLTENLWIMWSSSCIVQKRKPSPRKGGVGCPKTRSSWGTVTVHSCCADSKAHALSNPLRPLPPNLKPRNH